MAKIDALGYIVAQSTDVSKWQQYAEQILGMSTAPAPGGGLYIKMDDRAFRIAVQPGAEDRYLASGWQVLDRDDFDAVVSALQDADVAVDPGSEEQIAARQVNALASFTDPAGNVHEISYGNTGERSEFVSPLGVGGFKTGKHGMGHTVLPALPFDDTLKLFTEVLGFGVSDEFDFQMGPDAPVVRIRFLHCNGRHHSLALAEMPNPAGCVHAMVEVNSMTDVGKAHDRMQQNDIKLMATLGQHENDDMTSFYMMTPGNFALEYGWGGKIIDPQTYQTTRSERVSVWGHDFSVGFQ